MSKVELAIEGRPKAVISAQILAVVGQRAFWSHGYSASYSPSNV
jgi:hypothetical protein